jgi:urease accessory protein
MPGSITSMTDAALYKLLAWFSPAMPVGAYSYSHGLEWAVAAELVHDAESLRDYLETALRYGFGRLDAMFLRAAFEASDEASLGATLSLAAALRGTRELALESTAQGRALLGVLRQAWPAPALDRLAALCARLEVEPPYACVAGVAAAAHRLPLAATLLAFLHAFSVNLLSAGIRLIPLGQTEGQRLTAALGPVISAVTDEVRAGALDDLGTASPMIDWCSMCHETQRTRLFRS